MRRMKKWAAVLLSAAMIIMMIIPAPVLAGDSADPMPYDEAVISIVGQSESPAAESADGTSDDPAVLAEETCPFRDVPEGKWFYDSVMYVYARGMMNGMTADTFEPQTPTTRAMLVTVLHRLEGRPETEGSGSFADVPEGQWYTDAAAWAREVGLLEGGPEESFGGCDAVFFFEGIVQIDELAVLFFG